MKKIIILGSTGSIGKQTLEIIKKDKNKFKILLLSTDKNINLISKQVKIFKVKNNRGYVYNFLYFKKIALYYELMEIYGYEAKEITLS